MNIKSLSETQAEAKAVQFKASHLRFGKLRVFVQFPVFKLFCRDSKKDASLASELSVSEYFS